MPSEKCGRWTSSLNQLLRMLPSASTPAHWRYAISCMTATSERGASGHLRRWELRALLRRANASTGLSHATIEEAFQSLAAVERELELPVWLTASGTGVQSTSSKVFNLRQVAELLLRLCTASEDIQHLFQRYAPQGRMDWSGWSQFLRTEQLPLNGDREAELNDARMRFEGIASRGSSGLTADRGLSEPQFALQLLDFENNAVTPARNESESVAEDSLTEPLACHWMACSHNSYVVGDQLTGISTHQAYRRQLLQVMGATIGHAHTPRAR
jgi:hypothetical protein